MPKDSVTISDGQTSWSAGVNSISPPSIASPQLPDGLKRNELPWLVNGTVRDGGITPRPGYRLMGTITQDFKLYQGGIMYEPDDGDPYLLLQLSGALYKVDVENPGGAINLSATKFVQPKVTGTLTNQFIVLKNLDYQVPPNTSITVNAWVALPPGHTPFQIPAIGQTVTVKLTTSYTGHIGDILTLHNPSGAPPDAHWQVLQFTTLNINTTPTNPADIEQAFFVQAERFVVIQAGDGVTLPLIWDGDFLTRSIGINDPAAAPDTPGVNQIPAATAMDYFQGRIWYAQGRTVSAGDIVRGKSGTLAYNFRDAVLSVTESPAVVGGDGFSVPSEAGNIRAVFHTANLDSTLGQGRLYFGTRKGVFGLDVPVTRADWIATTSNAGPRVVVAQINNGPVNDRTVVRVNGDVFYQSLEPDIRSLIVATRFFSQWGNTTIAARENRVLKFNDREFMHGCSGVNADNRLLQTVMPRLTTRGIVSDGIIPLDFTPVSDPENAGTSPSWEGLWEGLSILQIFTGDFGGRERTFVVTVAKDNSAIQLWEISENYLTDYNQPGTLADILSGQTPENRISMQIEFPAVYWSSLFDLKELLGGELWVDRVYGEVVFNLQFRQDATSCWLDWHQWKICQPRNSCELEENPICYPSQTYCEGYRQTMVLPKPQTKCEGMSHRPTEQGYMFQCRLTVKGFCRIRGLLLHAVRRDRSLYEGVETTCP